jgi:hypothetical protein
MRPTAFNKAQMADITYQWASNVPAFEMVSTDPEDIEIDVPIDKAISIVFSLGITPPTLNSTNIIVSPDVARTTSLTTSATTITIDPTSNLANNSQYTVTVTTNMRDLYGPWKVHFQLRIPFHLRR